MLDFQSKVTFFRVLQPRRLSLFDSNFAPSFIWVLPTGREPYILCRSSFLISLSDKAAAMVLRTDFMEIGTVV